MWEKSTWEEKALVCIYEKGEHNRIDLLYLQGAVLIEKLALIDGGDFVARCRYPDRHLARFNIREYVCGCDSGFLQNFLQNFGVISKSQIEITDRVMSR